MQMVLKLHQGSLCAKLAFGQVFSPHLNPPSIHGAGGSRGAHKLSTTEEQLPPGSQLTAKGKHLLEELFVGKMTA